MNSLKKIGLLTSGGDSPGMNACVRAVVRTAIYHKLEVCGITHGYDGLIKEEIIPLERHSVANIIHLGGTILKTARSKEFMTKAGMDKAYDVIKRNKIDALVVVGGDGTFKGANQFSKEYKVPVVAAPGTIDNDLFGTDFTIGYDTAINTVIEAVDKIRDTAESHDRLFFVEVMGRDAGLIALRSGIAVGAEAILIPETKTDINELVKRLGTGRKSKSSKIIIIAEGDEAGGAIDVAKKVKEKLPYYDTRVTVLGHIQRGGSPTCMDRVNASKMGYACVQALIEGHSGIMIGIIDKKIVHTPLEHAVKHIQKPNDEMLKMIDILSL